MSVTVQAPVDAAGTFRLARQYLAPGMALAQKLNGQGAVEWYAEGAEVHLSDERVMLDWGSYAVTLIGHRHPDVLAAVREQLDLMPTSTRSLCNPVSVRLAEKLVSIVDPERLGHVWFGLNGSDVVEASFKLARVASGRTRLLAVRRAFHGKTMGSLAATWGDRYRAGLESVLAPVTHLDPADPEAVRREVAAGDVAALVIEPVQGEGGVRPLPAEILRQWAADAHEAGAFVISDEIQAGLGRCGHMSVSVALGLSPDAVLYAKALGGGVLPISAMLAGDRLYAPLVKDPFLHTSTFSGHPLGCAAAIASLDVIQSLLGRAEVLGARIEEALRQLRSRHPDTLLAVRGQGLLWGIELAPDLLGHAMVEANRGGLLFAPCLVQPEVLRLLPPMVTTDEQLDRAIGILDRAFTAAARTA